MHAKLGLAVLALALVASGATAKKPAEVSSSAILFYDSEFQPWYGQPISQCDLLLNRAKAAGSKSVNIVPTQYWVDERSNKFTPGQCHPDNWAENQKVDYYCSKLEWNSNCEPFTEQTLQRFKTGIKGCIKKAHDMFDEVLMSPHLDDGTKTMHWRNMLWFDPLVKDKYGYSYWDIMLSPILEAVKEVYTTPGKKFVFGAEGEMGGTVFYAPDSYLKIVDRIKGEYKGPAKLETALMFNHALLPGVLNRGDDVYGALPESKFWKKDGGWGPILPFSQWPEYGRLSKALPSIQKLLNTVDVLGVSCYPRTGAYPKPVEVESCAVKYDSELKVMGFDLKTWTQKPGKRFIFNEFGLGGGISECGDTPARNREEAGRFSWLGGTSTFNQNINPWKDPTISQFNRDFYKSAFELFKRGGIQYDISNVFLWNCVSWDVQGIHPASSEYWGSGSYKDPTIMDWIVQYNRDVQAGRFNAIAAGAGKTAEPVAAAPAKPVATEPAKKPVEEAKKPEAKPAAEAKPTGEAKKPEAAPAKPAPAKPVEAKPEAKPAAEPAAKKPVEEPKAPATPEPAKKPAAPAAKAPKPVKAPKAPAAAKPVKAASVDGEEPAAEAEADAPLTAEELVAAPAKAVEQAVEAVEAALPKVTRRLI